MRTHVLFVCCFLLLADRAVAQPTARLDDRNPCRSCTLEIEHLATLGSPDDTIGATSFQVSVSRDSKGRHFLAPLENMASVGVYSADGTFERAIGRQGSGPGEFGFIMRATTIAGDSLIVLDVANRRVTWLNPELNYVRATTMYGRYTKVWRYGDSLIVLGSVGSAQSVGLPLHVVSPEGEIARSFGSVSREVRRDRPQADLRLAVRDANPARVWLSRYDQYLIELWNVNGTLERSWSREVDWFPPRDYAQIRPGFSMNPMAVTFWIDNAGLIWTLTRIDSESYREPAPLPRGQERPARSLTQLDHDTYTMLEVLDPVSGRVVATRRLSEYFVESTSDGHAYSLREGPNGEVLVDVWRFGIRGYNPTGRS